MKMKIPLEVKRANKALFFAPQQINLSIMGRAKLAALAQALMLIDIHRPNLDMDKMDIAEPLIEYVDSRAADLLGEDLLRSGAVTGIPMADIYEDETPEMVIEEIASDEPTEAELAELEKLITLDRLIAEESI